MCLSGERLEEGLDPRNNLGGGWKGRGDLDGGGRGGMRMTAPLTKVSG